MMVVSRQPYLEGFAIMSKHIKRSRLFPPRVLTHPEPESNMLSDSTGMTDSGGATDRRVIDVC